MDRRDFIKAMVASTSATLVYSKVPGSLMSDDLPQALAEASVQTTGTVCEMCTTRCTVVAKVKEGKVAKMEGHPKDGGTAGTMCARGNAGVSLLYDPDRLKYPLIRVGERGEGKWRKASWDEAYTYIAEKMNAIKAKYGPEAVAMASRKGPYDAFFHTLGKAYGSPNMFTHMSTCPQSVGIAKAVHYGTGAVNQDLGNTKYIISIGRNYFEGLNVAQARAVRKALNNGAKMIYVDPRFTVTASKATEWLPLAPGTDVAFVWALLHVLIKEKLYDADFVTNYTTGFEELSKEVEKFTPEWAEKECGIPKEKIVQIAREYAAAKPKAVIEFGWRSTFLDNDLDLRRAIVLANVIIGNYEKQGGCYGVRTPAAVSKIVPDCLVEPLKGPKLPPFPNFNKPRIDGVDIKDGMYSFVPVADGIVQQVPESILTEKPYPIKGFFAYRFNPVISITDSNRVIEAIKKLDLMVTIDVYMTDSAWYSDVVLPECTYLERFEPIMDASGAVPRFNLRQPAVPILYPETKPYWQLFKELGEKMGLGAYFPWKDINEYMEIQLAGTGVTLEELKKEGFWTAPNIKPMFLREADPKAPLTFPTPSNKIELVSSVMEKAQKRGLPRYETKPQPPAGKYRFIQGKVAVLTNVASHNVPWLAELIDTNSLWIHPDSAAKLGVRNGDNIIVKSPVGQQKGKAKVTEAIRPDCVYAHHGFGRVSPELKRVYGKGIGSNFLLPNDTGHGSNTINSATFVDIQKA